MHHFRRNNCVRVFGNSNSVYFDAFECINLFTYGNSGGNFAPLI